MFNYIFLNIDLPSGAIAWLDIEFLLTAFFSLGFLRSSPIFIDTLLI